MLAIYNRSGSFSDSWIDLCRKHGIEFVELDLFDSDLFSKLKNLSVRVYLTHPPMYDKRSSVAARNVIHACSMAGVKVFPSLNDFSHFDDKIAQKYIFEALDIPTPKTWVFYSKPQAVEWVLENDPPYVFKLRSGAGSINVSLIDSRRKAIAKINRMFSVGYASSDSAVKDIATKIRTHRKRRDWIALFKRLPTTLGNWVHLRRSLEKERGYVYLQEFIPQNTFDTRVTVIGSRAFGFRRNVRPGDFRASGSGSIDYEPNNIDTRCVRMAFDAAAVLGSTCMAFDFVEDKINNRPLVVEMSFAFVPEAVLVCPGYWDRNLQWVVGNMRPQDAIFSDYCKAAFQ